MRAGRQGRGACGTKMSSARTCTYTSAWHSPLPLDAQNNHSPTRYRRQVQPNLARRSGLRAESIGAYVTSGDRLPNGLRFNG